MSSNPSTPPSTDAFLEDDIFDADLLARAPEDDEEETTGGLGAQGRQRTRAAQRLIATRISAEKNHIIDDGSSGGLAAMGISALIASYAAYAAAYAMRAEQGRSDGGLLRQLAGVRAELQKRCIIDVLLPLLAHVNPFVHVTAAIDILCTVFEHGDRAAQALRVAGNGGRGFVPFLARFALDTYFHAQFTPLPGKVIGEATRLYGEIPRSVKNFNENLLENRRFPHPEKILSWDGNEHTGRFLSVPGTGNGERYYAQHVGMNEYQVYASNRLTAAPQNGEIYHVRRDGSLQQEIERSRAAQSKQARGKA